MLVGLALLGFVVSGAIGAIVLVLSTGGSVEAMKEALNDPANAHLLRFIQVFSVLISMFLPAWFVANVLNRRPFQLLGFRKKISPDEIGLIVLILFVSLFLADALGYVNKQLPLSPDWKIRFDNLEKSYGDQVKIMLSLENFGGYIMSLLVMALLPAICEEMLFRGGLQNFLTRATKNPWLAIIIVSLLFSLVHFSFYGFLPRMFLGLVLGLIYYLTGNIWLSIIAHFLNNALGITMIFIYSRMGKNIDSIMNEGIPTHYWGFLALPVVIVLFRALKRSAKRKEMQTT
jgi:membrane protease YdiL (CAAX protease family)